MSESPDENAAELEEIVRLYFAPEPRDEARLHALVIKRGGAAANLDELIAHLALNPAREHELHALIQIRHADPEDKGIEA